ncbi:PH domain-containing protein [Actinomadura luteofluorescens]|uniref:PH domain-containing protein n=1 Tax=Actinomadura luteofluorescens TaxID=46163 RepID=UPI003641346A
MEPGQERRWRVPPGHVVVKCAAAAAVTALLVLYSHDPQFLFLAGAAAIGLNVLALRDLVAPVRLAADGDGLTVVTGYARRHRLRWEQVVSIRVDERRAPAAHADPGDRDRRRPVPAQRVRPGLGRARRRRRAVPPPRPHRPVN